MSNFYEMSKDKNKASKSSGAFIFLNPRTDFGFKKVFENEDVLISFLNEILPEKVVDIEYLQPEQLGFKPQDRKAVYDIYCKNDKGKRFIVEMQATPQPNFAERGLFYASHSILSQAPKGKIKTVSKTGEDIKTPWDYSIDGVYVIGILDFELFTEASAKNIVIEHIQMVRQKANIVLTDKLRFVTVELPKFTKKREELDTMQDKWLYSLKNMEQLPEYPEEMAENVFRELYKNATIENLTEEEMKTYQKSVMEYDDVILSMNYVKSKSLEMGERRGFEMGEKRGIAIGEKRGLEKGEKRGIAIGERRGLEMGEKRGLEKGEKRGIAIGERRGLEMGEKRGHEKGRESEQIKFVRNCYKHNMSIDEIAKLTDLKVEQVSAILHG
jgi:predicted transposase/invertase (TIGR01784 family)